MTTTTHTERIRRRRCPRWLYDWLTEERVSDDRPLWQVWRLLEAALPDAPRRTLCVHADPRQQTAKVVLEDGMDGVEWTVCAEALRDGRDGVAEALRTLCSRKREHATPLRKGVMPPPNKWRDAWNGHPPSPCD